MKTAAPPDPAPEKQGTTRWWLWGSIAAGVAVAVAVPLALWAFDEEDPGVPRQGGTGGVVIRF